MPICVLTLLASCGTSSSQIIGYDWTDKEQHLRAEVMQFDTQLLSVYDLILLDDYIIFQKSPHEESQLALYRLTEDRLQFEGEALRIGKGPNELLTLALRYVADEKCFQMIDFRNSGKRVLSVSVEDPKSLLDMTNWKESNLPTFELGLSEVCPISESSFIVMPAFMNDNNMLSLVRDTMILSLQEPYPDADNTAHLVVKALVYGGDIDKRPAKQSFVYASRNGKYVFIFDLERDRITHKKVLFDEYPLYVEEDGFSYAFRKESVLKMIPTVTARYIYLLNQKGTMGDYVKGQLVDGFPLNFGNEVLVFDWNGDPVKRLGLDRSVEMIRVDPTDDFLYGVTRNKAGADELIRFNLN